MIQGPLASPGKARHLIWPPFYCLCYVMVTYIRAGSGGGGVSWIPDPPPPPPYPMHVPSLKETKQKNSPLTPPGGLCGPLDPRRKPPPPPPPYDWLGPALYMRSVLRKKQASVAMGVFCKTQRCPFTLHYMNNEVCHCYSHPHWTSSAPPA